LRIAGREANIWTVFAIAILAVAFFLVLRVLTAGGPLEVTVVNSTLSPIEGLALATASGQTEIAGVAAGSSVTVRPRLSDGKDRLSLLDAQGRSYILLSDVDGNPGGTVTVIISGESGAGLEGSVEGNSDYFPKGQSTLKPSSP
jgi:hypothetical protein